MNNIFQEYIDKPSLIKKRLTKKQLHTKFIKIDVRNLTQFELDQLIKHIQYKKGEVIEYVR